MNLISIDKCPLIGSALRQEQKQISLEIGIMNRHHSRGERIRIAILLKSIKLHEHIIEIN